MKWQIGIHILVVMDDYRFELSTPGEVSKDLAQKARRLRLDQNWKQEALAERAGVSLQTVRLFEQKGKISLKNLLFIVSALGRLSDFDDVMRRSALQSMQELETQSRTSGRERASR